MRRGVEARPQVRGMDATTVGAGDSGFATCGSANESQTTDPKSQRPFASRGCAVIAEGDGLWS